MSRLWTFRLIASGVPIVIGTIAVAVLLHHRGQLVVADGTVRLAPPPL